MVSADKLQAKGGGGGGGGDPSDFYNQTTTAWSTCSLQFPVQTELMEKNCLSFAHCTLRQLQDPEPGEQYSRFKGQLCTLFGIAIASRFLSVVLISVIIKCLKRKDLFPNFIYICNILEIRFWVYLAKQRMHWSQEVCAQFTGSVNTLPELPQLSVHTWKYIEVWSPTPLPPPPPPNGSK